MHCHEAAVRMSEVADVPCVDVCVGALELLNSLDDVGAGGKSPVVDVQVGELLPVTRSAGGIEHENDVVVRGKPDQALVKRLLHRQGAAVVVHDHRIGLRGVESRRQPVPRLDLPTTATGEFPILPCRHRQWSGQQLRRRLVEDGRGTAIEGNAVDAGRRRRSLDGSDHRGGPEPIRGDGLARNRHGLERRKPVERARDGTAGARRNGACAGVGGDVDTLIARVPRNRLAARHRRNEAGAETDERRMLNVRGVQLRLVHTEGGIALREHLGRAGAERDRIAVRRPGEVAGRTKRLAWQVEQLVRAHIGQVEQPHLGTERGALGGGTHAAREDDASSVG